MDMIAKYQLDTKRPSCKPKEMAARRRRLHTEMRAQWLVWCEWLTAGRAVLSSALQAAVKMCRVDGNVPAFTKLAEGLLYANLGAAGTWARLPTHDAPSSPLALAQICEGVSCLNS
jgi:hypothetical protein